MDVNAYLASGIIDEYSLGLLSAAEAKTVAQYGRLYPAIQEAIDTTEIALRHYANTPPRPALKQQVLGTLRQLAAEPPIDLTQPPLIHRHSSLARWNDAVRDLEPNLFVNTARIRVIHNTPQRQLCVAWITTDLIEDEHDANEFQESFFILEGSCNCTIGDQLIHLQAGDYLDIPANTLHTIRHTSPQLGHVKALIQRVAA